MELTFTPALTEQTIIPAPSNGTVKVQFKATFVTRTAFERIRDENVSVEMWTNLPSGDSGNEWHALRFSYPADTLAEHDEHSSKVLSLVAPVSSQAPDRDRTMLLDLELRDVRPGSTFSFTYRLAYPSGATEWLGSYGQNGSLAIQERDERLEVAAAKERELLVADPREETRLATVNRELKWVCWSFGANGYVANFLCLQSMLRARARWPTASNDLAVSQAKAVLLIPSKGARPSSVVMPEPLLFGVTSPDASLRIDSDGQVFAKNESSVFWSSLNTDNAAIVLAHALPETSRVVNLSPDGAFAMIVTRAINDALPVALSFVPLTAANELTRSVMLGIEDLQAALPVAQTSDVVLVDPSTQAFCFIDSHSPQDVSVRVGAAGGQILLSPLHALTEVDSEAWKLAVLSPTVSVSVETRTISNSSSPALPTPPPSPPPPGVALPRSPSEAMQAHTPLAVTSYQSFQALAEASKVPDVIEPLTPTSPDQKILPLETEQSSEQPKEEETSEQPKEVQPLEQAKEQAPEVLPAESVEPQDTSPAEQSQALTVPPRSPRVTNSLLRFFFAWLIRALLARVWGLVGTGARMFGLEPLLLALTAPRPTANGQGVGERPSVLPVTADSPVPEQEAATTEAAQAPVLEAPAVIDDRPVDAPAADVSEAFAVEDSVNSVPGDVPDVAPKAVEEPEVVVAPHHKPEPLIFAPTILGAQPAKTRTQTRFLADVRSNVVSLLVHAPTTGHKPSNLAISINEKRVENEAGYRCEQLSSNVYLLGLDAPENGSTVAIALD